MVGVFFLGSTRSTRRTNLSEWPVVDCHAKHLTIGCLTNVENATTATFPKTAIPKGKYYIFQTSIFRCENASFREGHPSNYRNFLVNNVRP